MRPHYTGIAPGGDPPRGGWSFARLVIDDRGTRATLPSMARTRTRPDESGKPSYITAEGYRRLELEAEHLWNVERPKMAKAVQVAAAEGDRSENAEYIYSRKKLREIDARLKYLGKRLEVLTI